MGNKQEQEQKKKINDIWVDYLKTRSIELEGYLVDYYKGQVLSVVYMLGSRVRNADYDDMYADGLIGLLDAIRKYDITRCNKFETYARLRIKGQILDGLRARDVVSRSTRRRLTELCNLEQEYQFDKEKNSENIAEKMGISLKDYWCLKRIEETLTTISTDVDTELTNVLADAKEEPIAQYLQKELKQTISEALTMLTERERDVIRLYYFEDRTFVETANYMNLTSSRISQIHSKAIRKLRRNTELKTLYTLQ